MSKPIETKALVKITHCNNDLSWYFNRIGEVFDVIKRVEDGIVKYTVDPIKVFGGYRIEYDDCVELTTQEIDMSINILGLNKSENISDSILLEANKIVNGDRNEQYGDIKEAFSVYAEICHTTFDLDLSPDDVCKVLMAVKLGRLKYKYKHDSIVDLCGYAEILSKLNEL